VELYQGGPSKADHTIATFEVSDIEEEVNMLKERELILRSMRCPKSRLKTA
jgi:hypothetical protein